MNKIWVVHNSEHGNSLKISQQFAKALDDEYDVTVKSIRELSSGKIAKDEPYALIVVLRVLAFSTDKQIGAFLEKLDELLQKPISKIAYFFTHALKWKKFFAKGMNKTLKRIGCVEEVCPEFLEIKMEKAEGPAVNGSAQKVNESC